MPLSPLALLSVALWCAAGGLFAATAFRAAGAVTYVTLADGRQQARALPLVFRVLLPLAPNFRSLFSGESSAKLRADTHAKIVAAGYEGLLSDWEFLSMRILVPLCTAPIWIALVRAASRTSPRLAAMQAPLAALGIGLAALWPSSWLRRAVNTRQQAILRSLPFVLDLLTLSVEAGLDFMTALARCAERPEIDPLTEELLRVVRETQLGSTRRDALRAMASRVSLPEVRSVVGSLVQADELGVSLGSILRIQSEQVRARRFERAEKLANEAPVKLLAPLMLFIFPSVFLVLLGPVIHQMLRTGF